MEVWQLLVAAVGGVALLFGVMIPVMQFLIRATIKPLERSINRDAEHVRGQFADLRTQLAEQNARIDAKFDRVFDGLRDLGERVARLEGALHPESRVGAGPPPS